MTFLIIIILLLASGLFSGLNLGLMSLEPNELARKAKLGNKDAEKIYPIRKKGNQLLVTIILSNVALNSILAIYLGSITQGVVAAILATALITIFGEILPQSIISRFAIPFGARTAGFVKFIMWVLSPICKPIAILLDKSLGEELPTVYSRKELIEILEEHGSSDSSDIKKDEERIAAGALNFGSQSVKDVMSPRSVVFSLITGDELSKSTVETLTKHGYSRIPVTDETSNKVIGILYAYNLINKDYVGKKVDEFMSIKVHYLNEDDLLDHSLKAFIKTKQKLFIVVNEFKEYVGAITIEDILEDIIGQEIVDEFDEYTDLRKVAERKARKTKD
jgi:metal transporter CNNM